MIQVFAWTIGSLLLLSCLVMAVFSGFRTLQGIRDRDILEIVRGTSGVAFGATYTYIFSMTAVELLTRH